MTTFNDIFKKSFLEGFASSNITSVFVIAALSTAAFLGIYIFFVYRVITRKTFYSKTFSMSLVGVAMITSAIIITIQSSIVVSLGMVGALSIVRFRTAIKDPIDLMFLFWSISVGIICGAGLAEFAVILSLMLTAVLILLDRIPVAKAPMILVVNITNLEAEDRILHIVRQHCKYAQIKSRNLSSSTLDLTIEVRTKDGGKLIREIMKTPFVFNAALLMHDGEVTF